MRTLTLLCLALTLLLAVGCDKDTNPGGMDQGTGVDQDPIDLGPEQGCDCADRRSGHVTG